MDRPKLSFWATGLRENLHELLGVIDLAASIGIEEVYLQRMVFGFGADGLARPEQSIYVDYRAQAEAIIADAERRAARHGISFRVRTPSTTPEHRRATRADGARAVAHCVWRT